MAIWTGILQFKPTHPNIQINAFGSQSKGRCRNDDPQSGSNDQTCRSRCAMLRPIFELPIDYSDWSFPREVKDFFPPVSWTKILAGWSWHLSNLEDLHSPLRCREEELVCRFFIFKHVWEDDRWITSSVWPLIFLTCRTLQSLVLHMFLRARFR